MYSTEHIVCNWAGVGRPHEPALGWLMLEGGCGADPQGVMQVSSGDASPGYKFCSHPLAWQSRRMLRQDYEDECGFHGPWDVGCALATAASRERSDQLYVLPG